MTYKILNSQVRQTARRRITLCVKRSPQGGFLKGIRIRRQGEKFPVPIFVSGLVSKDSRRSWRFPGPVFAQFRDGQQG